MPKDSLLDVTPIEVLNEQDMVKDVADYLNISPSKKTQLEAGLPVSFKEVDNMFNNGAFRIVSDANGRHGEILLKSNGGPGTWIEETTHYIQTAGNHDLQQNLEEIGKLYETSEAEILTSIDELLVVADRARQIAIQDLDDFALQINIKPTHAPQSTEEIANAIKIQIGSRTPNGYYEGGTLSGGQLIQIKNGLDNAFGKQADDASGRDIDHYLLASKALIKVSEEVPKENRNREIRALKERKSESQEYISSNVGRRVTDLLGDTENISTVENVFNKSHVSIDGVTFRSEQITQQIVSLSDDQAKQCLVKYLAKSRNVLDLLTISQLIPGKWLENYEALHGSSPPKMETVQASLVKDITLLEVNKMEKDPRKILGDLIKQTESIASAQAGLEINLIYLMDDFPVDEKTRSAMLGNPEFVKAYINATLAALKSGDVTPLNIALDTQNFSQFENTSNNVSQVSLEHAFSDPEAVIFFQELVKKMDYERYRSPNADRLLMYGNWQLDMQFIADGIDLEKPIGEDVYAKELQKARGKSFESIKRRQEMDKKRHLRDVLVEPIAKVLVAQRLGNGRESVVFPQNMMGGYSELLTSGDSERWVDTLWLFVERVHNDKSEGEKMIFDFIACNSIKDQQLVVNKYLKQNLS